MEGPEGVLRPIFRLTRFLTCVEAGVGVGVVEVEEDATGATFHAAVRD